jgi:hypothetical protein
MRPTIQFAKWSMAIAVCAVPDRPVIANRPQDRCRHWAPLRRGNNPHSTRAWSSIEQPSATRHWS